MPSIENEHTDSRAPPGTGASRSWWSQLQCVCGGVLLFHSRRQFSFALSSSWPSPSLSGLCQGPRPLLLLPLLPGLGSPCIGQLSVLDDPLALRWAQHLPLHILSQIRDLAGLTPHPTPAPRHKASRCTLTPTPGWASLCRLCAGPVQPPLEPQLGCGETLACG